jgi:molybdopterin-dependent oxidoreductase alpha subunit
MSTSNTPASSISDGNAAAGGWGALKSVGIHLTRQGIPVKGARTLLATNQPDGFDCPGCAWPDRNPDSSFQFCENGAKAVAAEATARRASPEVLGALRVSDLEGWTDQALEDLGRLTHPMRWDEASDTYVPVSWDTAISEIAATLRGLSDPDQALFYTSGRTSNEAAFLYQLFVRLYGTNNLPDCSNMCHEPSGVGLRSTLGTGKGSVSLDDFDHADLIMSFGHNPGTNHPRMLAELKAASRRGARIAAFNPLRERGLERFTDPQDVREMLTGESTPIASHYFRPRVGGDPAVLAGLCKRLIELDDEARAAGRDAVIDHAFIAKHTSGFEAFSQWLRALDWDMLCLASGLGLEQLHEAAQLYADARATIICWGMGITQHEHGVMNVELIAALLLMRGNVGRPGAGPCPIRGHSNVQGDRTMGIDERPSNTLLDALERVIGAPMPREPGMNTVEAIAAMREGRARVFFGLGGNFAAATPDSTVTAQALRQCELTVHVSTKLNRSHVVHGQRAFILPCLGRTEIDQQAAGIQAITVEDSMSMVHRSVGRNQPASPHLLSEPDIVARLAEATLPGSTVRWRWLVEDYNRIRDLIAQVIPGFENFNARVAVPGGFQLPNAARERRWATASGRAEFHVPSQALPAPVPAQADTLLLTTIRSHDQYNTTVYGLNDRYRGVQGERRVLFISQTDLQRLGLHEGQRVDIEAVAQRSDGSRRVAPGFVLRRHDIPAGCIAGYYPETNVLVALESFARGAGTPASKSVPVRLLPSASAT